MLEIRDALQMRRKTKDDTWKFFLELGDINGNQIMERSYQGIKNAWLNEPCYIIGSGPDLGTFVSQIGWPFLDGKHTIGINHTIEDYDRFEWFLFLDKRFLLLTTYDMSKYMGRVFAHCATGKLPSDNVTIFHTNTDRPTNDVQKGLFSGSLSGLCALNLALISGASPIYLIGFGMGKGANAQNYHYKEGYTGEKKEQKTFDKFVRVQKAFRAFENYADQIVHVTDGKDIPVFTNKLPITDISKSVQPVLQWTGTKPRIVHISFTNELNKHADITRYICTEGFGEHVLVSTKQRIPEADLYITEHFLSTDAFVKQFVHKDRAINIVHTVNCIPPQGYLKNIALTDAWKKYLEHYFVRNIEMIHGGIDVEAYKEISADYDAYTFGRITRYSAGKIHPDWNETIRGILEAKKDAQCIMFTQLDQINNRPTLAHERMVYDKSCQISSFKGEYLKRLSIYVHANGSFKETLSFAVIEAMATGLPIVFLDEKTGVLDEVTGGTQIKCATMSDVQKAILTLLDNPKMKMYHGAQAKTQAKRFDKRIMLAKFDKVMRECLKK